MSIIGKPRPWTHLLPQELLSHELATRLSLDSNAINLASTDFGKLIRSTPAAVLYPSSHEDIANLIKFSNVCSKPFNIAARGRGHSVRGQAMAIDGVVIDMRSLNSCGTKGSRIEVGGTSSTNFYVDVGGEQLWIDVLNVTLERGLSPRSWTDYLYLTVGGTLSNAGISGQSFRYGPQISNVYEMDVITGRGETETCSKHMNSELFFAVLGGLGQFGIITRARIALDPAPQRVRWVRMLYHDFSAFTRDQEHLISITNNINNNGGDHQLENNKGFLDYVEGSVMTDQISPSNNWRSSFFSSADHPRITSLTITKQGASSSNIIYSLEVAKYYDHLTMDTIYEELDFLLDGLSYIPGFIFTKDVSYVDFLNRVRIGELKLQAQGLWDVPHPWLSLFVPKSQILEFNSGVFHGILKHTKTTGPLLLYPTSRNM
ncbi:FAD linked oxidase [Macleaya cordata]|uniref:cytokinin dehydrogenase n=1 Tax=Macleaya cordata TaxID=56857 RepID=A0A200QCD0_MACCD|nr:FAD linked oxidase [Macleaya cordata]